MPLCLHSSCFQFRKHQQNACIILRTFTNSGTAPGCDFWASSPALTLGDGTPGELTTQRSFVSLSEGWQTICVPSVLGTEGNSSNTGPWVVLWNSQVVTAGVRSQMVHALHLISLQPKWSMHCLFGTRLIDKGFPELPQWGHIKAFWRELIGAVCFGGKMGTGQQKWSVFASPRTANL